MVDVKYSDGPYFKSNSFQEAIQLFEVQINFSPLEKIQSEIIRSKTLNNTYIDNVKQQLHILLRSLCYAWLSHK